MSATPLLTLKLLTQEQLEENKTAFEKIQAYPWVNHGKKKVWLGLVPLDRFSAEKRGEWLKKIAAWGKKATPAYKLSLSYIGHVDAKKNPKEYPTVEEPIVAVGLSSRAYSLLGIEDVPGGTAFEQGFWKRFSNKINEIEDRNFGIVVVFASNADEPLEKARKALDDDFEPLSGKISWEEGFTFKAEDGLRDRFFGFRENLSQPIFFKVQEQKPSSKWDPSANLSYVLTPQPKAPAGDEYGSYMAYLKIEQDADAFEKVVASLAAVAKMADDKMTEEDREVVKGWILGRHRDGKPLINAVDAYNDSNLNDFNFDDDRSFKQCPAAAHIRKVNPRTEVSRNHRILRRSVQYDERQRTSDPKDCGTLFQCFQSKLETGFEFVFRDWALNENHPGAASGADALLGARDCPPMLAGLSLADGTEVPFSIRRFTKIRHGEYFYFPSIPFFERLGSGQTQFIPELAVRDAQRAADYYRVAFNAAVDPKVTRDGKEGFEVRLGGQKFFLCNSDEARVAKGVQFIVEIDEADEEIRDFQRSRQPPRETVDGEEQDPVLSNWIVKKKGSQVK